MTYVFTSKRPHLSLFAIVAFFCAMLIQISSAHAERIVLSGGGGTYDMPSKTWQDQRFRGVHRQQYDFSCGSAALSTLLDYHYDTHVQELDILRTMYQNGDQEKIRREGFSLLDMKNYLNSIGLQSAGYRESLDKLGKVGIPAIALINRRGYMHFVVIKGVTADKVLIGDPALGMRIYDRPDFEKMWNNILFVITNKMDTAKPTFNTADAWGKHQFIATSLPLQDAALASYALSTSPTPNYY